MLNLNIIIHSGGGLGLSLILIRLDWTNKKFRFIIIHSCLTSYLVPLLGPRRQNCLCTRKKKNLPRTHGRKKKKKIRSAILASPSLAKPHEDKPSPAPSLPSRDPQKNRGWPKSFRLCCRLNHCFLLRSIISFRNRSSCPAHFLVPYMVAYTHAICLCAGCSSPV